MSDVTDQEILEVLELTSVRDELKQQAIDTAHTTVELRTMGLVDELMSSEQAEEFHRIRDEQGDNQAWDYINHLLGSDVNDLYQATMRDYLEQHKDDQSNLPF